MSKHKKQHYVPRAYLKAWTRDWELCEQLKFTDKTKTNNKPILGSKEVKICYKNWFYEENLSRDSQNFLEIEKWLGTIETKLVSNQKLLATFFEEMCTLFLLPNQNISNEIQHKFIESEKEWKSFSDQKKQTILKQVIPFLSFIETLKQMEIIDIFNNNMRTLKEFMAVQYVRTPAALKRLTRQLQLKDEIYTPNKLIKLFQESYLNERINSLNIQLYYIPLDLQNKHRFHTNDNPCIDYEIGSYLEPFLGSQIGEDNVIMYMPLSPSIVVILTPKKLTINKNEKSFTTYPFNVICMDNTNIKHLTEGNNNFIFENAERYVIY